MNRISEEEGGFVKKHQYLLLWLIATAIGVFWTENKSGFAFMFLAGCILLLYLEDKLKEVYFDGNDIFIKDHGGLVKIKSELIKGKVWRSLALNSLYVISFREKTAFGKSVLFKPRKKSFLFKHKAFKEFQEYTNTARHYVSRK